MKTHLPIHVFPGAIAALGLALAFIHPLALADGFPLGTPDPDAKPRTAPTHRATKKAKKVERDPLAVDAGVAVKDTPPLEVDLPGVLKLQGADRDLLDPSRVRKISWNNTGSQTVYVSSTQTNRIQLPFANPHVVANTDVKVAKRPESNNVYVSFEHARPVQMWIEPPGESSTSVGLQLVPKDIPAQTVIVVDDTASAKGRRDKTAAPQNDYLARIQSLLADAGLGAAPAGFSEVALELPLIAVDGLAVRPVRRLSGRVEDIYVYDVTNSSPREALVRETEFNGDDVMAVSILPKPLLLPGEHAQVVVLAQKHEGH